MILHVRLFFKLTLNRYRESETMALPGFGFGGGGDPLFFAPNHKGPPCTFGYPRIWGGGGPLAPPWLRP